MSGSTFLYSPSEAIVKLRTLFVAGDLSDVFPVDAEGLSDDKGGKCIVEGGGGGEDDGGSRGGGGGGDGSGSGGGVGGNRGGSGRTTNN